VARNNTHPSILGVAVEQGPVLIKLLTILDGEEGKLVKKYRKMFSLVEYKDLVRRQEEGMLSQQEFQDKLDELKKSLI